MVEKKPVESPRMKTGSFVIRHAIYRRFFSHLCRVALTGFCARYVRRTVRPSWLVPHFRPIWRSGRKYNIPVVIKLKISAPASFFSRRSGIYRFPSKRSSILDFFRSYPLANNVFLITILKSHFSLPDKKIKKFSRTAIWTLDPTFLRTFKYSLRATTTLL